MHIYINSTLFSTLMLVWVIWREGIPCRSETQSCRESARLKEPAHLLTLRLRLLCGSLVFFGCFARNAPVSIVLWDAFFGKQHGRVINSMVFLGFFSKAIHLASSSLLLTAFLNPAREVWGTELVQIDKKGISFQPHCESSSRHHRKLGNVLYTSRRPLAHGTAGLDAVDPSVPPVETHSGSALTARNSHQPLISRSPFEPQPSIYNRVAMPDLLLT